MGPPIVNEYGMCRGRYSLLEPWETTDPCMWAVSRIFTPFAVSQIFWGIKLATFLPIRSHIYGTIFSVLHAIFSNFSIFRQCRNMGPPIVNEYGMGPPIVNEYGMCPPTSILRGICAHPPTSILREYVPTYCVGSRGLRPRRWEEAGPQTRGGRGSSQPGSAHDADLQLIQTDKKNILIFTVTQKKYK